MEHRDPNRTVNDYIEWYMGVKNDMGQGVKLGELRPYRLYDEKAVYGLMRKAYDELEDKSLFVCDDIATVMENISTDGSLCRTECGWNECCLGFRDERNKYVACVIVRFPGMKKDNLGYDLGFSKDACLGVAHVETLVVAKEYRNMGLSDYLLDYVERSVNRGRYGYLMATVSPDNIPSCRAFEKKGYEIAATKEKYDGLTRRIYVKKLGRLESSKKMTPEMAMDISFALQDEGGRSVYRPVDVSCVEYIDKKNPHSYIKSRYGNVEL